MGVGPAFSETVAGDLSLWHLTRETMLGLVQRAVARGLAAWLGTVPGDTPRSAEGPVSLVGIGQAVNALGGQGDIFAILIILASLNVVLGVLNMLPLPPLDGGHLAVLAVEEGVNGVRRLRGRRPASARPGAPDPDRARGDPVLRRAVADGALDIDISSQGTAPAPFPRPAASAREARPRARLVRRRRAPPLTAPISGPEGTPTIAPLLVHVVLFGVLAAALLRPWQRSGWPGPVGGPMLAATAYGAAIELVQVALPYRTGDPLDGPSAGAPRAAAPAPDPPDRRRRREGRRRTRRSACSR
jgi:hypothetical protein